jgi:hypothetical protein
MSIYPSNDDLGAWRYRIQPVSSGTDPFPIDWTKAVFVLHVVGGRAGLGGYVLAPLAGVARLACLCDDSLLGPWPRAMEQDCQKMQPALAA